MNVYFCFLFCIPHLHSLLFPETNGSQLGEIVNVCRHVLVITAQRHRVGEGV